MDKQNKHTDCQSTGKCLIDNTITHIAGDNFSINYNQSSTNSKNSRYRMVGNCGPVTNSEHGMVGNCGPVSNKYIFKTKDGIYYDTENVYGTEGYPSDPYQNTILITGTDFVGDYKPPKPSTAKVSAFGPGIPIRRETSTIINEPNYQYNIGPAGESYFGSSTTIPNLTGQINNKAPILKDIYRNARTKEEFEILESRCFKIVEGKIIDMPTGQTGLTGPVDTRDTKTNPQWMEGRSNTGFMGSQGMTQQEAKLKAKTDYKPDMFTNKHPLTLILEKNLKFKDDNKMISPLFSDGSIESDIFIPQKTGRYNFSGTCKVKLGIMNQKTQYFISVQNYETHDKLKTVTFKHTVKGDRFCVDSFNMIVELNKGTLYSLNINSNVQNTLFSSSFFTIHEVL